MNTRILQEIFSLSRAIQEGKRTYYNARIVEFLTDYLLNTSESRKNAFIQWLDSSDKEYYSNLFN